MWEDSTKYFLLELWIINQVVRVLLNLMYTAQVSRKSIISQVSVDKKVYCEKSRGFSTESMGSEIETPRKMRGGEKKTRKQTCVTIFFFLKIIACGRKTTLTLKSMHSRGRIDARSRTRTRSGGEDVCHPPSIILSTTQDH